MAPQIDGGPAFPLQLSDELGTFHHGMTLRDYFAGQFLAGRAARGRVVYASAARSAYRMADAMLAERERL